MEFVIPMYLIVIENMLLETYIISSIEKQKFTEIVIVDLTLNSWLSAFEINNIFSIDDQFPFTSIDLNFTKTECSSYLHSCIYSYI